VSVRQDLLDQIDNCLASSVTSGYTTVNAVDDLFEGYIWSIVVAAAREQGAAIRYENVFAQSVSKMVFRTSPGFIYSTKQPYTHAVISFQGALEFEAHIGIRVTGRSQVLHECDVAVLDRSEAQTCRANQVHPRVSKVRIVVECKFHAATLQLGFGRAFLGLTADLMKENRFLVSNVGSANIERLATYHKTDWDTGLDLKDPKIPANLQARLSRVFRNLKALS
jgi:hypothetical protein